MKKNIILFITLLLISTSFFSGCSNNNNPSNSKIIISLTDFKDVNLTDEEFKNLTPPSEGNKLFYIKIKVTNLYDEKILTNPYYITIIDEEGLSFIHSQKAFKLTNYYDKRYIESGESFEGKLIYIIPNHSNPIKLQYLDPINNVNLTIPIK